MPKLQILKIQNIDEITGSGLGGFYNLRKLNCSFCFSLKDDGLMSLLRCTNNLELLDIQCCFNITNSLIDFAIAVTKNRKNNVVLIIYMRDTSINFGKIEENSPLLYLSMYQNL